MSIDVRYGKDIDYSDLIIIRPEDKEKLQAFYCGNRILDNYIHNEIFEENNPQGLHFMVKNNDNNDIIAFVSLATSGIVFENGVHVEVLPSIKIDVIAVDKKYQKMPYYEDMDDDHCYLSDIIMSSVIRHIRKIDEEYALVDYIVLYADKCAERYYERNGFGHYSEFMKKENKMEINDNIPMYMEL